MMGERSGSQGRFFYRFNLEDCVPSDHLLRKIDAVLDLSELRSQPVRTVIDFRDSDGALMRTAPSIIVGLLSATLPWRQRATRYRFGPLLIRSQLLKVGLKA